MLVICCVKQGDKYSADYVRNLQDGVKRHLSLEDSKIDFVCFTDSSVSGVDCEPLPEKLDGWWCKLGLFKPGVFSKGESVLYLDLDTLTVDNIDDVAGYTGEFAILRDFMRPHGFGSAIMAWPGGQCEKIWTRWDELGRFELMNGDQHWVEMIWPQAKILQDLFPDKLVSYKIHCRGGIPEGASIVNFHGTPRPHECNDWVKEHWANSKGG